MANGKFSKKHATRRPLALLLAVVLLVGTAIGGTIAWLTDTSDTITNTFTVGDINIKLEEKTGTEYDIIPGVNVEKDPVVTVLKNSVDCWLFVKVAKSANWPAKVTYQIADGWTLVPGQADVYYREVSTSTADQPFRVLKNDQIVVDTSLTKAEMNAISGQPTLTITAYAIQKAEFATAAAAWTEASK